LLTLFISFNVASGKFTATIAARSALALHTGATCTLTSCAGSSGGGSGGSGSVAVNFAATVTTTYGEDSSSSVIPMVRIIAPLRRECLCRGQHLSAGYLDCGILGKFAPWTRLQGLMEVFWPKIALSSAAYPVWKATVSIPAGTAFQYKYIKKETDGSVVWESDPNRSTTAPRCVWLARKRLKIH
jgi:hypothetical protein